VQLLISLQTFRLLPTESGIARLRIYSQKVRHLDIDISTRPLDCLAIQQLGIALGISHGLLPSLSTFKFVVIATESLLPSILFLGPGLNSLNLKIQIQVEEQDAGPQPALDLFWFQLRTQTSRLTSLYLANSVDFPSALPGDPFFDSLYTAISSFQYLHTLHLLGMPLSGLTNLLPQLPMLKNLRFFPWTQYHSPTGIPKDLIRHSPPTFWSDINLDPGWSPIAGKLRCLNINIYLDDAKHASPSLDLASVFESLADHSPSLTWLHIGFYSNHSVTLGKISSKTCFQFLQKLTLRVKCLKPALDDLLISDCTMSSLAASLPAIMHISMLSDTVSQIPSLSSIQAFAKYCPNLTTLEMNIDATLPPDSPSFDFPDFVNPITITFRSASRINQTSVAPTAMFLAELAGSDAPPTFMSTTTIEAEKELWNAVASQVVLLHRLRMRERQRKPPVGLINLVPIGKVKMEE